MAIKIQNTLTGQREELVPLRPGQVRIYLCGVTAYDRCHIGHLRANLAFDAVVRYLEFKGLKVTYVRNFTDVDDKVIQRAEQVLQGPEGEWVGAYRSSIPLTDDQWRQRLADDQAIREAIRAEGEGRHPAVVTSDWFIQAFYEDHGPFGLRAPDVEPRVSTHTQDIQDLIGRILAKGLAYEAEGSVYFDVPAYQERTGAYGELSNRSYQEMIAGARVRVGDEKRHPADFVLWKASRPGEPSWPSPWGPGRAGWHIECSAMSYTHLGVPFDIHGGGRDLIFPHHENEIAQSRAGYQVKPVNFWMHNGFVTVDGVKMAKSLGNVVTIREAIQEAPAEAWRLLALQSHYRGPIDFRRGDGQTKGSIEAARERMIYMYRSLARIDDLLAQSTKKEGQVLEKAKGLLDRFTEAMDDDFNTARALAELHQGVRTANEIAEEPGVPAKDRATSLRTLRSDIVTVAATLGLLTQDPTAVLAQARLGAAATKGLSIAWIEDLIAQRTTARSSKDWARADQIRGELMEKGVALRDTPRGTEWDIE